TLVVQSSSATIDILHGLYGEGAMTLYAAIPVLFGDNLETTITSILATLGPSHTAIRASFTNVIFNFLDASIFLLLLTPFINFVEFLQTQLNLTPQMTIAIGHGSFNIANTIIQFPFIGALAWIVVKLVPGEEVTVEYKPKHLDPIFIQQSST